jgi:hypothetical protein
VNESHQIPWEKWLGPSIFEFSAQGCPWVRIFALSAGSEHICLFLLHISPTIMSPSGNRGLQLTNEQRQSINEGSTVHGQIRTHLVYCIGYFIHFSPLVKRNAVLLELLHTYNGHTIAFNQFVSKNYPINPLNQGLFLFRFSFP